MSPDLLLFFLFSSPILALLIFAMACLLLHHLFFFFLSHSHNLPPGSMGWPYIGETLLLYSQNPNSFFATKQRRYGEVFKSHILGCPCVMIANPEGVKFVLSKANLFKPTFPSSKQRIIGPHAIFFHDGPYHAKLRKLVLASFLPDSIRHVVPAIEQLSIATLDSWVGDDQGDRLHGAKIINTFMEIKKFIFKVGILLIFGEEECLDIEDFNKAYTTLEEGYNCMPIDIPGTKFNKAMKARRHLTKSIEEVIKRRRRDGRGGGLLEKMMEDEGGQGLRLHEIVDNIIGIIFASRDTTASVLTWVIKFLKTSPDALLDSVIAEQEMIRVKKSQDQEDGLTWKDTRNMPLTMRVIQETLRLANILSFTFREAIEDVEYNGYFIPKGWKVLPLFRNIHHNPELFPEPQKFDPSRFDVPPKPNTFLPFGNGVHACPGNELAKLEILIFIHHLTTKFRWELHEFKNGVQYSPFRVPREGLPIRVERK